MGRSDAGTLQFTDQCLHCANKAGAGDKIVIEAKTAFGYKFVKYRAQQAVAHRLLQLRIGSVRMLKQRGVQAVKSDNPYAQRAAGRGQAAAQRSSLQGRGDDDMGRTPQASGSVAYLFNYPGSLAGSRRGGVDLSGHRRR